jgi:hypothetical protein
MKLTPPRRSPAAARARAGSRAFLDQELDQQYRESNDGKDEWGSRSDQLGSSSFPSSPSKLSYKTFMGALTISRVNADAPAPSDHKFPARYSVRTIASASAVASSSGRCSRMTRAASYRLSDFSPPKGG